MTKYHINSKGIPAICTADLGKCPFGDHTAHFPSLEMAQKYADAQHKVKYNILPNSNAFSLTDKKQAVRKCSTRKDKEILKSRILFLKNESEDPYIKKCKEVKKLSDYKPAVVDTFHFKERQVRADNLTREFGEGEIVGFYKVNHLQSATGTYKEQIVEVRDTGQLYIYDIRTGKKITTFMVHRSRLEAMFVLAGEVADESFLEKVNSNRDLSLEKGLN